MNTGRLAILAFVGALGFVACSSPGANNTLPQQPVGGAPLAVTRLVATPSPTPGPTLGPIVYVNSGYTNGASDRFKPKRGDTLSAGQGQPVDNTTCEKKMVENQFHIHSYLGVLVNGQWYATPDAIGMYKPGKLINGYVNFAHCFYQIHSHDGSGEIHQEVASSEPLSGSLYTLQNVLDIWGQPITANSFGTFTGLVRVFTATTALRDQYTSGFTEFFGDPNTIQLYSHSAVFIEVGPPYVEAANLPTIRFQTEY